MRLSQFSLVSPPPLFITRSSLRLSPFARLRHSLSNRRQGLSPSSGGQEWAQGGGIRGTSLACYHLPSFSFVQAVLRSILWADHVSWSWGWSWRDARYSQAEKRKSKRKRGKRKAGRQVPARSSFLCLWLLTNTLRQELFYQPLINILSPSSVTFGLLHSGWLCCQALPTRLMAIWLRNTAVCQPS